MEFFTRSSWGFIVWKLLSSQVNNLKCRIWDLTRFGIQSFEICNSMRKCERSKVENLKWNPKLVWFWKFSNWNDGLPKMLETDLTLKFRRNRSSTRFTRIDRLLLPGYRQNPAVWIFCISCRIVWCGYDQIVYCYRVRQFLLTLFNYCRR